MDNNYNNTFIRKDIKPDLTFSTIRHTTGACLGGGAHLARRLFPKKQKIDLGLLSSQLSTGTFCRSVRSECHSCTRLRPTLYPE